MNRRIIAACGNDCAACPRYVTHPYGKTDGELRHTAELWMKIGYRDRIVSNREISCTGCKPENWCRYHVVRCCEDQGIKTCADCGAYPCAYMQDCFTVTKSFEPKCREVCTDREYERLRKAFFEKEANLKELQKERMEYGMNQSIERMTEQMAAILKGSVHSVWLYGSIVLDDFRPGWSDIDLLVLTGKQITDHQAQQLVGLRQSMLESEPDNPLRTKKK